MVSFMVGIALGDQLATFRSIIHIGDLLGDPMKRLNYKGLRLGHKSLNLLVVGSSPTGGTNFLNSVKSILPLLLIMSVIYKNDSKRLPNFK